MKPANLLILPVPASVSYSGESWTLPGEPLVQSPRPIPARLLRSLNARRTTDPAKASIRLLPADAAPARLARTAGSDEGYALRISSTGIDLWAAKAAGTFYGLVTLHQLIRQFGTRLPGLVMGDAPVLARRGVQLSFPQGHTEYRPAYMRRLIPELANFKINELYLYLESYFDFPSLPHMAGPGAMTPAEAKSLDALCREHHITLIPMLNTLAHCGELLATQRYQPLTEHKPPENRLMTRPFNLCSSSRAVERIVDGMLDDLMDCFTAPVFHVGGDEVSCLGECPECARRAPGLDPFTRYSRYYGRILRRLQANTRRGGIWGDMLLHYTDKKSKPECQQILKPWVDNGAIIYDWHYDSGGLESLQRFTGAGLTTIACSSTQLCYTQGLWPAQRENQRELFADAIRAEASGGMTTAWGNFAGVHEEQVNFLHATGATLLWSGPKGAQLAPALSHDQFEAAWSLQRYGMRSPALTRYLHAVGDATGPVLSPLPIKGHGLRKALYHTTNPLDFWAWTGTDVAGKRLTAYRSGIGKARKLWTDVKRQAAFGADPYLKHMEGPLLGHEHLLADLDAWNEIFTLYDQAAQCQYERPADFRRLLARGAARATAHTNSFAPLLRYLTSIRKDFGLEQSSLHRVRALIANIREFAAFLLHLRRSHRPLPSFQQFHNVFFEPFRTDWYGDREHEWAAEPPRFLRFSLRSGKPPTWAPPHAAREECE